MGGLLSLLRQDAEVNTEIYVDFENALPTEEEREMHAAVVEKMAAQKGLLQALKSYTGCGEIIRKAISSPCKNTEDLAWQAVCPAVARLKEFFDYSSILEDCFVTLLKQLCVTSPTRTLKNNLETYQASVLALAQLLTFALDFDDLKMTNPSIQNDFSYYRRTLSRLKSSPEAKEMLEQAVVKDELANRMSLFYAYPTPMLKVLVDKLASMTGGSGGGVQLNPTIVTECFSTMVMVCHVAVSQNNRETLYFCLRVMVVCIILYDHVHPRGAFVKDSEVQMKSHIKLIQTSGGPHTEGLLNALRYTTKHLNDETTPKTVKVMLG